MVGHTLRELFDSVESVLRRLINARIYAAGHTLILFSREVRWRGKAKTGASIRHNPERIRGLVEM